MQRWVYSRCNMLQTDDTPVRPIDRAPQHLRKPQVSETNMPCTVHVFHRGQVRRYPRVPESLPHQTTSTIVKSLQIFGFSNMEGTGIRSLNSAGSSTPVLQQSRSLRHSSQHSLKHYQRSVPRSPDRSRPRNYLTFHLYRKKSGGEHPNKKK